jgi:hypothetical protein
MGFMGKFLINSGPADWCWEDERAHSWDDTLAENQTSTLHQPSAGLRRGIFSAGYAKGDKNFVLVESRWREIKG